MTHIDNIPHILENGITHAKSPHANSNYKPIGDKSLIENRAHKMVRVDNGDYTNASPIKIILGDYIPFYFGVKMPMLYVIKHGGNMVQSPVISENIVYLACKLEEILGEISNYYFTDGHAMDAMTSFYNSHKIMELPQIVSWKAIKSTYWGGDENLNMKRKKQAEFLCGNTIPPKLLKGFVCYNENAKMVLIGYGISENKIKVSPRSYF